MLIPVEHGDAAGPSISPACLRLFETHSFSATLFKMIPSTLLCEYRTSVNDSPELMAGSSQRGTTRYASALGTQPDPLPSKALTSRSLYRKIKKAGNSVHAAALQPRFLVPAGPAVARTGFTLHLTQKRKKLNERFDGPYVGQSMC